MNNEDIKLDLTEIFSHGSLKIKDKNIKLDIPELLFLGSCLITAFVTLFFVGFIFHTAMPVFQKEGLLNFILGTEWSYEKGVYGIRFFIIGTILMTLVTLILAVPVSIFTAIFLSEFASVKVVSVVRPLIELLVGIPSVVYGIFGLKVLEDIFQNYLDPFLNSISSLLPFFQDFSPERGTGVLLASTVLAVMILPTITSLTEDAMRSVPFEYREASFSLGATKWETIRKVVLPISRGGVLSAIILGTMRAMGETMAIVMLLGNTAHVPRSVLDTGYAMTSKILNEITYYVSMDEPRSALFGIAAVLFAIEIVFVGLARVAGGRK